MDLSPRFYRNVNRLARTGPWGDCWEWTGKLDKSGYPQGKIKRLRAYVFACELRCGPMPDGYEANHICNRRSCVNPDHIEQLTRMGNLAYREILQRLQFVPRPSELAFAIATQAMIEAETIRMPHDDTSRYQPIRWRCVNLIWGR